MWCQAQYLSTIRVCTCVSIKITSQLATNNSFYAWHTYQEIHECSQAQNISNVKTISYLYYTVMQNSDLNSKVIIIVTIYLDQCIVKQLCRSKGSEQFEWLFSTASLDTQISLRETTLRSLSAILSVMTLADIAQLQDLKSILISLQLISVISKFQNSIYLKHHGN